ncbi:hypothetical protein KC323_g106 [Hortaea werneckii]|nr:hypothetical protein KC323_g106 [Hortaea werneckii]
MRLGCCSLLLMLPLRYCVLNMHAVAVTACLLHFSFLVLTCGKRTEKAGLILLLGLFILIRGVADQRRTGRSGDFHFTRSPGLWPAHRCRLMASVTAAVAFSPMIAEADERYCQMPYAALTSAWSGLSCLSLSADLDRALPSSRAVMVPLVPGLLVGLYANVGPKSTFGTSDDCSACSLSHVSKRRALEGRVPVPW